MHNHYDVLGVDRTATPDVVRRAYLRRARALHPDRQSGVAESEAARSARAMQEVNEAWRVLRDPASRSAYDRRFVIAVPPIPTVRRDVDLDDEPFPSGASADPGDLAVRVVRGLPWAVVVVVLAAIFVFTAFAGGNSSDQPSSSEWIGRCVGNVAGVGTAAVSCDEPNAGRVDLVVISQSLCPKGVSAVPVGDLWLCVREVAAAD